MKIDNIILPEMIKYYVAEHLMNNVTNKLLVDSDIEINDNHLDLYIYNSIEISKLLRVLMEKSKIIPIGDQSVHQYEIDTSNPKGNIFTFKIDDKTYNCILHTVSNLNKTKIHIVFNIIK